MNTNTAPNEGARGGERETRLNLAFSAWQLVLHLWQSVESGDPRLWPPHVVAYLHDLLLLGTLLMFAKKRWICLREANAWFRLCSALHGGHTQLRQRHVRRLRLAGR